MIFIQIQKKANKQKNHNYIKSPLNYNGNKYRLLTQIIPLLPENINTFVEPFCGSCCVGLNVSANKYIFNDVNRYIISIYRLFQEKSYEEIFEMVTSFICDYKLSKTNEEGYLKLRNYYNNEDNSNQVVLYVLLCHCYNNQFRVNKKGDFNMPFGRNRSDFNLSLQQRLKIFCEISKEKQMLFFNTFFDDISIGYYDLNPQLDFVYIDPPYLISTANYNENGGWTEELEKRMLEFTLWLTQLGIRWAMSNVTHHKGKENIFLLKYIENNPQLTVHKLEMSYKHSSYNKHDKNEKTTEVLLTNY